MLSKKQARYIRRTQQLNVFFSQNKAIYTKYKAFDKEVLLFVANLLLLEAELPQKDVTGTGITEEKDALKKVVAEECGNVCGYVKSYAIDIDDKELEASVNYKYNKIWKMKDGALLGFVTRINNLALGLIANEGFADYGVTPEMLAKMMLDGQNFNNMLGQAAVVGSTSSVANQNIDAALAAMNRNIEQFDLLINYFKLTDPNFVAGYKINAKLNDAGVHHNGIEGFITNDETGEPIEDAVIRLVGTDKETVSSVTGAYALIKMRNADYKLEVVAEGYETKTMIIKILRGKISVLNIVL